jgi:Pyridoxamine 5'-phosphate oxidase
VASWAEFASAEPDFAARVRALLTARKHLTMATLRSDGSPRISGTEISIDGGRMTIGSMAQARKALDLLRDSRVAIHGPTEDPPEGNPGGWSGEAKVAGRAVAIATEGDEHAFEIEIEEAVITRLGKDGEEGLVIESWNPARGYRKMTRA